MTSTDLIIPLQTKDIVEAIQAPDMAEKLLDKIRKATDREFDMTTQNGRDECRSVAASVTRSKKPIEETGLALTEDLRTKLAEMTTARKRLVDEVDAIAKETRKPLGEWEVAEKARISAVMTLIDEIKMEHISEENSVEDIDFAHQKVAGWEIGEDTYQEFVKKAEKARDEAVARLGLALKVANMREENERQAEEIAAAKAKLAEAEAEREAERKAQAEREAKEAKEREKAAQAERERIHEEERKKLEEAQAAAKKAQAEARAAERKAQEAEEAREREKAEREAEDRKREQDALDAEQKAKDETNAKVEAEEVDEAEFAGEVDAPTAPEVTTADKIEMLEAVLRMDFDDEGEAILRAILADYTGGSGQK